MMDWKNGSRRSVFNPWLFGLLILLLVGMTSDVFAGNGATRSYSSELLFGPTAQDHERIYPWLSYSYSWSGLAQAEIVYRRPDLYWIGYRSRFSSDGETSIHLRGGKGIGPDKKTAWIIGLGDETRPMRDVSFFAIYYPWSYLIDTHEGSDRGIWEAGTRIGSGAWQVTLTGLGNPEFDGYTLDFEIKGKRLLWKFGVDTTEQKPYYYFGAGLGFGNGPEK